MDITNRLVKLCTTDCPLCTLRTRGNGEEGTNRLVRHGFGGFPDDQQSCAPRLHVACRSHTLQSTQPHNTNASVMHEVFVAGGSSSTQQPAIIRTPIFPKTLGVTVLSSEQLQEKYGIPKDCVPKHLDKEIKAFVQWSSTPIMLDRDERYSHGVQSTTLEGQLKHIRGYMGFASKYNTIQQPCLTLTSYQDPELFASFVSYLMARGVTRTPLIAHASKASGEGGVWVAYQLVGMPWTMYLHASGCEVYQSMVRLG